MFHISSDISIRSPLRLDEVATILSCVLEIPPFVRDVFGRWEGSDVLVSKCFGLQFTLSIASPSDTSSEPNEYALSIDSNFEAANEGPEKTIDATRYTLLLLRGCQGLVAIPAYGPGSSSRSPAAL